MIIHEVNFSITNSLLEILKNIRDCKQIMILYVKWPSPPLFLTDNIKQDGIPIKIKCKGIACFTHISRSEKVLLWEALRYSYTIFYLLLFYISFFVSRYHFLQHIRTSFNIIWIKIVVSFPFFVNSLNPQPLNDKNLLNFI